MLVHKGWNHSTPSSCYHWEFGCASCLWRARWYVDRQKQPCLIFGTPIPGNSSARYLNAGPLWSIALTQSFISPILMWRGSSKILLTFTSGRCRTFFFPSPSDCRVGHSLFLWSEVCAWLSHSHYKQQNLMEPCCSPRNVTETFRSPQSCHWYFFGLCSSVEALCCYMIYSYWLHIELYLMATFCHYGAEQILNITSIYMNFLQSPGLWFIFWAVTKWRTSLRLTRSLTFPSLHTVGTAKGIDCLLRLSQLRSFAAQALLLIFRVQF